MSEYLRPGLSDDVRRVSVLGLAHVGDAVYDLMVRTWLCMNGVNTAKGLHSGTVSYVCAKSQSVAFERIKHHLNEDETAVYKRGRNAYASSVPRGSTHSEYHRATGLETLFGYLYLRGDIDRLDELFEIIINR